MQRTWHHHGRHLTGFGVAGAITWWAFGLQRPVPFLDWFDLAVHEAGHMLAMPLPRIAMFMAGSFLQVALPLAFAWYFGVARRDRLAGGFCLAWAGTSAWDVSVYAGDAVTMRLPLVGGGEHDWAYILGHFDALHLTDRVAAGIRWGGLAISMLGLAVILWSWLREVRQAEAGSRVPDRSQPFDSGVEDPWLAAASLPFHHDRSRTQSGSSVG